MKSVLRIAMIGVLALRKTVNGPWQCMLLGRRVPDLRHHRADGSDE